MSDEAVMRYFRPVTRSWAADSIVLTRVRVLALTQAAAHVNSQARSGEHGYEHSKNVRCLGPEASTHSRQVQRSFFARPKNAAHTLPLDTYRRRYVISPCQYLP